MENTKLTFSDKVKYVRYKLKLSQEALAKEIGVSFATVSRWERENREPQLMTLSKFDDFCKANGIDFIEGMHYENNRNHR